MNLNQKVLVVFAGWFAAILLLSAHGAAAVTPTLTVSSTGDGDTVQLDVTGDPNKSVLLLYTKTGAGQQLTALGTTNASGLFSLAVSTAAYGIEADSLVRAVIVGVQSPAVAWPTVAAGSSLSLSKTSLVLPLGQSQAITAYNNGTSLLFLSNNSNPPVANVSVSGSQITISALNYGSTIVTVCAVANTSSCASAYVTVQNTGAQPLVFSQSNTGVKAGQTSTVSVIGGNGSYLVLNNTNPAAVQASLSGSTVNLSTTSTSGSASITVCSSDMSACGIINAIVGNAVPTSIAFGQTNPVLTVGQSLNVAVSGGGGSYSVFSNSNATAVQANLSGNTLGLTGLTNGTATVTVCSASGSCGALSVAVNTTSEGGQIKLSQNNLWLMAGQTLGIGVSGGYMPYSLRNNSANLLKATLENNVLSITGLAAGSASVDVCSAGGACTVLAVLVNGTNTNNNTNTNTGTSTVPAPTFGENNLSMLAGENAVVTVSGNGGYYVSSNSNPAAATALINGNAITVSALVAGSASISICQTGGQCSSLAVSVTKPVVTTPTVPTTPATPATLTAPTVIYAEGSLVRDSAGRIYVIRSNAKERIASPAELQKKYAGKKIIKAAEGSLERLSDYVAKPVIAKYKFTAQIVYGASGKNVTELQKRLVAEGFYSGPVNGRYLSTTLTAVKKYQKAKGIKQTGSVGPQTLAALNK